MSITAKKIVHNLSPKIRELDVPDADIPGVEYTFQLKLVMLYNHAVSSWSNL